MISWNGTIWGGNLMSSMRKSDYLKKMFAAKKKRRKELARLPFSEKLKIWLGLKTFYHSGWRNR